MAALLFGVLAGVGAFGAIEAITIFAISAALSAIDNFLLFPALFPPDDIKGDRVSDFQLSPAAEGVVRNYALGEYCRVGAQITWVGATLETEVVTSEGGKKSGPQISHFEYSCHLAFEVTDEEIESIDRVWADGRILYVNPDKPELADITIILEDITFTAFADAAGVPFPPMPPATLGANPSHPGTPNAVLTSPTIFTTGLKSGSNIHLSGFNNAENNTNFVLPATLAGAAISPSLIGDYLRWKILSIPDSYTLNLRAWANNGPDEIVGGVELHTVYRNSGVPLLAWWSGVNETPASLPAARTLVTQTASYRPDLIESISNYLGTGSQTVNALIQAEEGATVTPAFRHRAYCVIEKLNLTEFGNRLPQFQVQLAETTNKTVAATISDILVRAGLSTDRFDVSAIATAGTIMEGYNISGPQAPRSALQPIMMTYNIAVQEDGDKLTFYFKDAAETYAVDTDYIGTNEVGSPGLFSDQDHRDKPSRINVKYIDTGLDLQAGAQSYRRVNTPEQGVLTADLQLSMSAADAQCRARRILWSSWANGRAFSTKLAPRYYDLLPGDIVTFSYDVSDSTGESISAPVRAFILRSTRGEDGSIEIEGLVEDAAAFVVSTCEADTPLGFQPSAPPSSPPPTLLEIVDIAPLRPGDETVPGFYYFGTLVNPNLGNPASGPVWNGATLYQDSTSAAGAPSTNFQVLAQLPGETTMGAAGWGNLANPPMGRLVDATQAVIDRKNTVSVTLSQGAIASITHAELMEYGNLALLGEEIIAFQTVTPHLSYSFILSNIVRGIKGTRTDTHRQGERFVMLNSAWLRFVTFNAAGSAAGVPRNFKLVPTGGDVATTTAYNLGVNPIGVTTGPENFLIYGKNRVPAPICNVRATRNSSNDLTITWQRTTRSWVNGIASTRPVNEPFVQFQFEFFEGASSLPGYYPNPIGFVLISEAYNIIRPGLYSLVVTDAQQLAIYAGVSGWGSGDPVFVEGRQVSASGGPAGRIRERFEL